MPIATSKTKISDINLEKLLYTIMRLSSHVIENLNFCEIQKQAWELSQITVLASTKAKEMVNKYEVFYYLNVFGLH